MTQDISYVKAAYVSNRSLICACTNLQQIGRTLKT